jgi:photosystem II stability/assembly factor-like uncharacterized protein
MSNHAWAMVVPATLALIVCGCSTSSSPPPTGEGGTPPPHAWNAAVGSGGSFAQTFDTATWSVRSVGAVDLFSVTCANNEVGWAAGVHGAIAHTLDGGQTWTWQASNVTVDLHSIRFGSTALGVAVGNNGTIIVTHDGGAHWAGSASSTSATLRGAAIAAGAAGTTGAMIVVGDGARVLRSVDGGSTWLGATIAGASDLRGVATDPGGHVVLAVDTGGNIWASTDTGQSFHRESLAPAPLEAVSISDDASSALAVGAHGTVLERSGLGWITLPASTTADLHAALVTGAANERRYAAGDGGTLLTSADHGRTWSRVALATSAALYGLDDL